MDASCSTMATSAAAGIGPAASPPSSSSHMNHGMSMLSPAAATGTSAATSTTAANFTEEGLIVPRKLMNPCLESRERIDLHRELRFNVKAGINVLDQKSELTKVLEKRQAAAKMKEREQAEGMIKLQRKSSFERKLEEQAIKIMNAENQVKNQSDDHHNNNSKGSHDPEAEFLRIHAKIYEKKQLAS